MVWYFSKWLSFSAAAMVMLSAGLAYTFSIYSVALKQSFNLSQTQIAGIGTACNFGGYLALPAGLVFDALKRYNRLGPFVTVIVGVALNTMGYFSIWASITGKLTPDYWLLLLFAVLACNGQTWFETAALVTCVQNFETERGTVIGILKAMLGLSASVYTAIYVAFLDPNSTYFLLLLAIGPSLVALASVVFINKVPFIQSEPHTKSHAFHLALTATIGLALYQGVIALARNAENLDYWSGVLMTGAMAILLLPILAIPFIFGGVRARQQKTRLAPDLRKAAEMGGLPTDLEQPLLAASQDLDMYRDKTPMRCLRSVSFWMLIFINGVGSGAGLTFLNNLGEETVAMGNKTTQAVFVSMFSIANCLGRLSSGFLPDKLMRTRNLPRTASLIFLSGLTVLASLLNAVANIKLLGLAALLSGFAFGAFQGVIPAIASEIFGLRNFATNYAMLQLGPAAGSYGLATWLAGTLYDRAIRKHGGKGTTCKGPDCFRATFLIIAALAFATFLLSVMLHRRTLPLYARVIEYTKAERRRRGRQAEVEEERYMMRRCKEENGFLRSFVVRYRSHLCDLQGCAAELPDRAQQVLSELHSVSSEADILMASHDRLYEAYASRPSTPR